LLALIFSSRDPSPPPDVGVGRESRPIGGVAVGTEVDRVSGVAEGATEGVSSAG